MLNIIEINKELEDFLNLFSSFSFDCIFSCVCLDPSTHPLNNGISCIFCYLLKTNKYYCLPVNHSESSYSTDIGAIRNLIQRNKRNFVFDKKSFDQLLGTTNTIDLDTIKYLDSGQHFDGESFDTQAHKSIQNSFYKYNNLNRAISLFKHGEKFKSMCSSADLLVGDISDDVVRINEQLIPRLTQIESSGLFVNKDLFLHHFGEQAKKHITPNGLVHSQYFIYTSAGRPSNRFGGINYAALKKDDGCRQSFQSRFGDNGSLVLMDYNAFHPRLISQLIGLPFAQDEDPYTCLAKEYFKTINPTEEQITEAKTQTFQLLYGGVTKEFEHIEYFRKTKEFTDNLWKDFKRHGFIKTPIFEKKIRKCHIDEVYASKLMNYLLQNYETEVCCGVMGEVLNYCKNYQSKLVLYTYDSFLFDFCKDDGVDFLRSLKTIVQSKNTLPVKCHKGNNYHEMERFDIY